jgi:hypothetical protein
MIRHSLYLTVALLTFAVGMIAWDTHRTLNEHGHSPIRRLLRIRLAPAPRVMETPPPLIDAIEGTLRPDAALGSGHLPGVVAVYFVTDFGGRVVEAWPLSGDPDFHQRAVEAAHGNRYPRRQYRGRTISSAGIIIYQFVGERRLILDSNAGPAVGCGS